MPFVPGLHPHPRPPLRLDRPAQPPRLPRRRDKRGDGVRPRRRRLLLLRDDRGRLADPLVQRPHRAPRGELRRADRSGAGAAHLRARRRRRLGRCPAPRSTPAGPSSCSPTSTTSTTTATRPTSPATPSSSPATTRRWRTSPTPASSSCRRPGSRTSTGRATASTPPTRSPATCSPSPGEISPERLREAIPAAIERAARAMVEPEFRELLRPRRRAPPRRRGGLLARGRRGLAVVRPLRLPGDRAPRHRRRRLQADVLALPRGGGSPRGAARRRRRRRLDRLWQTPSTPRASATSPTRRSGGEIDTAANRVAEAEERLWDSLANP